jgi:hypothetical protein
MPKDSTKRRAIARRSKTAAVTGSGIVSRKKKQPNSASALSDPVDLRQPKDPDPLHEVGDQIVKWLQDDCLTLEFLSQFTQAAKDEILQGNERFREMQEKFAKHWRHDFQKYDDPFPDYHGVTSVEQALNLVIEDNELGDSNEIYVFFQHLLNPETASLSDPKEVWAPRELMFRLAQCIPTTFFKLKQARTADNEHETFWMFQDPTNPGLRTFNAIVQSWVVASALLGHPWRSNYCIRRGKIAGLAIPGNKSCKNRAFPPPAIPPPKNCNDSVDISTI